MNPDYGRVLIKLYRTQGSITIVPYYHIYRKMCKTPVFFPMASNKFTRGKTVLIYPRFQHTFQHNFSDRESFFRILSDILVTGICGNFVDCMKIYKLYNWFTLNYKQFQLSFQHKIAL